LVEIGILAKKIWWKSAFGGLKIWWE